MRSDARWLRCWEARFCIGNTNCGMNHATTLVEGACQSESFARLCKARQPWKEAKMPACRCGWTYKHRPAIKLIGRDRGREEDTNLRPYGTIVSDNTRESPDRPPSCAGGNNGWAEFEGPVSRVRCPAMLRVSVALTRTLPPSPQNHSLLVALVP